MSFQTCRHLFHLQNKKRKYFEEHWASNRLTLIVWKKNPFNGLIEEMKK